MQAMRSSIVSDEPAIEATPGPLPKPPGRPPAEPIVIRTPPRPRDDLEIERVGRRDEDGGEIRRPPGWVPDLPPPPRPEERGGSAVAATNPHGPASAPSCS